MQTVCKKKKQSREMMNVFLVKESFSRLLLASALLLLASGSMLLVSASLLLASSSLLLLCC